MQTIQEAYQHAKTKYLQHEIDTEQALQILKEKPISIHCWQADDVTGFEKQESTFKGGIMATGNYPGKPRKIEELWMDLEKVFALTPGTKRLQIHAIYGKYTVQRDQIQPEHFQNWVEWAKKQNIMLDFNPTLFGHPMADTGFTLSSKDLKIREFWIRHVEKTREISNYIGREQGSPCIHNLWIPDGMKDITIDSMSYRALLKDSLDKIYETKYSHIIDTLESKLFGLGSETYVVGSHDFYLGYAIKNGLTPCLDTGHYHPTESVADKITAILQYVPELFLHISRGVRWDSDHIPIQNTDTQNLYHELVRSKTLPRVHLGLDYFDASVNRIGAYIIGIRSTQKALLYALLEPIDQLRELEEEGRYFERLALLEEQRTLPLGAIWDYYCTSENVPVGVDWIKEVQSYEETVLSNRG